MRGPMVALTNELAGSDGDIFSHAWKMLKLGPLVGKRTWGGVVGIEPYIPLADGTFTTQPEFAFWFKDVGVPDKFPPLDDDDFANLRKGTELFAFFVEVIPHKFQADDEGFLGTIPHEQLTTPYADRSVLEIGKGDWVVVNPAHFVPMLQEFDAQKLLDKYDDFVKYVRSLPDAPNRRDDGRMLAETAVRALADLKVCVATAAQNQDALLFRLLPPPG